MHPAARSKVLVLFCKFINVSVISSYLQNVEEQEGDKPKNSLTSRPQPLASRLGGLQYYLEVHIWISSFP